MKKFAAVAVSVIASILVSGCGGGGSTSSGSATSAPADLTTRGGMVASSRAATTTVGNLLANPSFESGMANWGDWGNTQVLDGTGAAGTLRALRVGTAAGGAAQDVTGLTTGTRYQLSVLARVSDPSETVVVGVNMVDASGVNLAQEAVRVTNTTYSQASVGITAPANALKAQVYVWKNSGVGYAFVDELVFAQASASPPPPTTGGNLMSNGGFESALDGWQNWGNAAVVTGQSNSGLNAVRVGTGAGGVGNVVSGIQPGKSYRFTGQLKVSVASEVGLIGLAFMDSLGNHLLEQNVAVRSTSYTTAQLDMVAPPNADRALVYLWKNAGTGFVYADDITLTDTSAPVTDFGIVPLGVWPHTLLQVGRANDAYWVEDGVWGAWQLTRGNFTDIYGSTYEQYTGVSPVTGPNGEVAARIAWKWPMCCNEIKSFPSIIAGQKPGWFNTWTTPGGFDILLPDGTTSQVYPSGRTPGTFFPLQLPIVSLKTTYDYKHMSPPTGRGHLAYDMYLQSVPTQFNGWGPGISHEIIVPLDYWGGYGQYPTRNPQWYDHDVTIDGILYHVYIFKDATGLVLSTFGGSWKFIVFEPDKPIPPGTLDLAKIVNYVTTRKDVFGNPWATGHEYLVSAELGVETQYGTGDIQVNNFRIWR
ncbi:carbohydrate binding domain-containing protein [Ramlibacter ginsenosidimutans]|uniref:Carbohydrate binding domain-containing protein n=1 Tax=Ramlibacter ginsenosidimutans TaxID=502333 RepID=A0A934WNJ8_9BURK|nr:carbohydrate binding domain-containing protein [Ramlibacter ginsenosidimutans]